MAAKLRLGANLSLAQTLKVLDILKAETGLEIFNKPTSPGILQACNKICDQSKLTSFLCKDHILRFDGKTYQSLCGEHRHILAICYDDHLIAFRELSSKTADCISQTILSVLDEYNLCPRICVCDTEPTNTGKNKGVIVQLQKKLPHLKFEPCRLHLLDLILKHELEAYFKESSCGPNLSLPFVTNIFENWKDYRNDYLKLINAKLPTNYYTDLPSEDNRRRDYRILLQVVLALKFKRESGLYAYISLPNNPPSICKSRWNSRAIYTVMAELLSLHDGNISKVNTFIIEEWAKAWFGVRNQIDWNRLMQSDICQKSRNVIIRNVSNYKDDNPLTNELAERVFRMAMEKTEHYKSMDKLESAMIYYFNNKSTRMSE